MPSLSFRTTVAGTMIVLAFTGAANAAPLSVTPEAKKLLDEVAQAYKGLSSYSDAGTFTVSLKIDGQAKVTALPIKISLTRPNKIVIDGGDVRLSGDGKTLTTLLRPTKKYFETPSPANLSLNDIGDGPLGAVLHGGPIGQPIGLVLGLLLGADPLHALPERAAGLRVEPDRIWNGKTYQTLVIDQAAEPALRVLVDPSSKLIPRIEFVVDQAQLAANQPPDAKLSDLSLEWTAGTVDTGTPKAELYAFEAPAGFSKITAAEAPAPAEPEKFLVADLVGKPAPEFAFTVIDGAGKAKKLTKGDLAGKVVVLDFWATWCGPCLDELPEIQKLAEKFGKEKVVFVAIDQDDEPADDLPGLRKLVDKTLADNKLTLGQQPNTILGLDPMLAMSDNFRIEGYPSVVILGADGVIQAAHVGIDYPVTETLTREIEALLGGKSLLPATPAPVPAAAKP